MEEARRSAATGRASVYAIRPGSGLDPAWPSGIYVFYNATKPFCYAYVIPGEWYLTQRGDMVRSKDGQAASGVTFLPPRTLEGVEGATLIERARSVAVRQYEKALRQTLLGVELVPFESSRAGTWLLKAQPIALPNGQRSKFPLHVILDLSPHTVAEINVHGTPDDDNLARRIVETIRTTTAAECYWADLERMFKAMDVAKPEPADPRELAYAQAFRQAKSDTTHLEYQRWYRDQFFPDFNRFFEAALRKCSAQVGHVGPLVMGLVLTLDRRGAVTRVAWREETAFSKCLEPLIQQQRFPPAPKDDFHVGLESNP